MVLGASAPGGFKVRARITPKVVGLVLGVAVLALAGVAMIAGAITDPSMPIGQRLFFFGFGVLATLLFAGGGIAMLAQPISRRPMLEIHERGVVLPVPWPWPRSKDKALLWEEIEFLCAFTQLVTSGGGVHRLHYLGFFPTTEVAEREPASRFESFSARLASAPNGEALRYSLSLRTGLSATVEEIVEEARRHNPDLQFVDHRDRSWRQRRAKYRRDRGAASAP
jgi:hypothetical protein